jgi:hypothetical protein
MKDDKVNIEDLNRVINILDDQTINVSKVKSYRRPKQYFFATII